MKSYKGQLSPREIQVLRLISRGLTNKDVAVALKITPNTVKTHKNRIGMKLQLSADTPGGGGLAQRLTAYAYQNGIIKVQGE